MDTHPAGYAIVPVLGSQAIEALVVDVNPSTLSSVTWRDKKADVTCMYEQ